MAKMFRVGGTDYAVRDDGELGLSILDLTQRKKLFHLNAIGEQVLFEMIGRKFQPSENIVSEAMRHIAQLEDAPEV
jgi:hypothetical protein